MLKERYHCHSQPCPLHRVPTTHPSSSLRGAQNKKGFNRHLHCPSLSGPPTSKTSVVLFLLSSFPWSWSPHRRDCTACLSCWVSWSWNCKFCGPIQGGRLTVSKSFSQPQPAQQCRGHSLSAEVAIDRHPSGLTFFLPSSGPSQRTRGPDPVLLLMRHPLPPPKP